VHQLIAIVSFVMAVVGALSTVFIRNRDRQTMASVVVLAFLISFFINVGEDYKLGGERSQLPENACSLAQAWAAVWTGSQGLPSGGV
jgi:hypothetical protein